MNRASSSSTLVFGYGSLVNPATWPANVACSSTPLVLRDWRRMWGHCYAGPNGLCTLTIKPERGSSVRGLGLRLDDAGLRALDERERGYVRGPLAPTVFEPALDGGDAACTYWSDEPHRKLGSRASPIWRSYLDTVLAGFDKLGGDAAVDEFIATTRGWEAPILDDRDAPKYPRSERLDAARLGRFDAKLATAGILARLFRS